MAIQGLVKRLQGSTTHDNVDGARACPAECTGRGAARRSKQTSVSRRRMLTVSLVAASSVLGAIQATPAFASVTSDGGGVVQAAPILPTPQTQAASPALHLAPPATPAATAPASSSTLAPPPPPRTQAQAASPLEGYTPFTHWTRNAAGQVTKQVYAQPEFRQNGSTWTRIDPTVAPVASASLPFAALNSLHPIRFGATSTDIYEVDLPGGPIKISTAQLAVGVPVQLSNGVQYTAVAPGTDLRYSVSASGVKEEIVLNSALAPTSFTFHIADPKGQLGTIQSIHGGGYEFSSTVDGVVQMGLSAPLAYQPPIGTAPPLVVPNSAHMTAVKRGNGFDVTTSVDKAWLAGQTLPVILDPSFVFNDTGNFYGLSYYNAAGCGGCTGLISSPSQFALGMGSFQYSSILDAEPIQSYIKYDLTTVIPQGSQVAAGNFYGYVNGCFEDSVSHYHCNSNYYYQELRTLDAYWDAGNSWNDLNPITHGSAFATATLAPFCIVYQANGCRTWVPPGCTGCFQEGFGMQGTVQAWVNNPSSNHGFTARLQWPTPHSIGGPSWDYTQTSPPASGGHPYLNVVYTPPPGAVQNPYAQAGNASATAYWSPPAANGGPPVTSYTVSAYDASTGFVASQTVCASCVSATFTGLTNGHSYYFTIYATNSVGNGPSATTATITLLNAPSVYKTASVSRYALPGQVVTYSVYLINPYSQNIPLSSAVDTLPLGMSFSPLSVVTVSTPSGGGQGQPVPCGAQCVINGRTLNYQATTLAPGNTILQYAALVVDSGLGCLPATNTFTATNAYGSNTASYPLPLCESGLGYEKYWNYVNRSLGPQAQASVNAANGNLVVQQTDSTPIQAHGRLAFVLRRTYNSLDTAVATLPGTIGSGWQLNVSQSDDVLGDAVGASSLYVPSVSTAITPQAITLVDRDGTRHVFQPNGLATPIDAVSLNVQGAQVSDITGALATLAPQDLTLVGQSAPAAYDHMCVDETFTAPAGVHLGLWRYIAVKAGSTTCAPASGTTPIVMGYAAETTDRMRYEFTIAGQLVGMADGSGNRLDYTYQDPITQTAIAPIPGVVQFGMVHTITEPSTGRAYTFTPVSNGLAINTITVSDPAKRVTTYRLDGTYPNAHLIEVDNPDGSSVKYGYGSGCNAGYGASTGAAANQMCSETDPRGNITYVTYAVSSDDTTPVAYPTLPRVRSITDRRESTVALGSRQDTTTLHYYLSTSPAYSTADQAGHRQRFLNPDAYGRIAEVDQGDTSNNYSHQIFQTWDHTDTAMGAPLTCRQPDAATDNNLCHLVQSSFSGSNGVTTPNSDVSYVYGDEGQVLAQHQCVNGGSGSSLPDCTAPLDSTSGYAVEYFEGTGTPVVTFHDTVDGFNGSVGYGTVTSDTRSGGRSDAATLFAVIGQDQSAPPRGNLSGVQVGDYATYYAPDQNPAASPNVAGSGTICPNTGNTGLNCQTTTPAYDSSGLNAATVYTYTAQGQRATMITPLVHNQGGNPYQYVYYPDPGGVGADTTQTMDLSGTTSQGGWLKEVKDPTGAFVAYAYDAAGNVARTWDRNATQGLADTSFPGTVASPPIPAYTETLHGSGSTAYSAPWRYLLSQRDQLAELTRYSVDANGNQLGVRTPRGSTASTNGDAICAIPAGQTTFDTCQTFDGNDNVITKQTPAESSAQRWTYAYDAFNNKTGTTDANGHVTDQTFDTVNRLTTVTVERGPGAGTPPCRLSTSGDASIPLNTVVCDTTYQYDGVDNKISVLDGNAQKTTHAFDGVHREIATTGPRTVTYGDSTTGGTVTKTVYNADGHVTDICSPRQFTEVSGKNASSACGPTDTYAQHKTYDLAGRVGSSTAYRQAGQAETTSYVYDPDGNAIRTINPNGFTTVDTYSSLDRKTFEDVPRSAGVLERTAWTYDPSGDVASIGQPGGVATGNSSAGNLVIDGTTASASTDGQAHPQTRPYVVPPYQIQYGTITLQNGGWMTATSYFYDGTKYDGGQVSLEASGAVVICATCGITVTGTGPPGGQGGIGAHIVAGSSLPCCAGPGSTGVGNGGGMRGWQGTVGGGGGGGGHASTGNTGASVPGGGAAGGGGSPYGLTDLNDASEYYTSLGSGGGGGGGGESGSGGTGGEGGGFVRLVAPSIDLEGKVLADGGAGGLSCVVTCVGGTPNGNGGGGGGGSGGAVWLSTPSLTLGVGNSISVAGGAGGMGVGNSGGAGAPGRVRLDADATTGSAGGASAWGSTFTTGVGRVTAYSYDAAHRLIDTVKGSSSTDANQAPPPSSDGAFNVRARQGYDADGNVIARYDPRAFASSVSSPDQRFVTRTTYDADQRPITQYVPRYDTNDPAFSDPGLGSAQAQQCPTGASNYPSSVGVCVTSLTYDAVGNAAKLTLPTAPGGANRFIAYVYTNDNLLATVDAPSPSGSSGSTCPLSANQSGARVETCTTYDGDSKPLQVTDALGHATTTSYTADELALQVAQPAYGSITHTTAYQYDAAGNQTSVTDPSGNVTQTAYYADNLKSSVTAGANVAAVSNKTSYGYDPAGNATSVTSPSANANDATNSSGTPTVNTYTQDNLLLTTTIPVAGSTSRQTSYSYDDAGRKIQQATTETNPPQGQAGNLGSLQFTYFPNDRLSSETGRGGETLTYLYDPAGHQTSINDSTTNVTTNATYYLDGRLRTSGDVNVFSDVSAYDGAGSPASTSLNGNRIDYAYNDAELLASAASALANSASTGSSTASFQYDAAARLTNQSDPNGNQTASTYNPDNTLACQSTTHGSTVIQTYSYDYFNNFQRKDQQNSASACAAPTGAGTTGDFAYIYDAANRLSSFQNGTSAAVPLTWDHNSNRTGYGSVTFTYNADNTIATASNATSAYTYDADGRLTADGCSSSSYTYDGFDRVKQATPCGATATTYAYDGLGRQATVTASGQTTDLAYRGLSTTVGTETVRNQAAVNYVSTPAGVDTAVVKAGAAAQYFTADGSGSVGALTDAAGAQVCATRFDPFGNPLNDSCNAAVTPDTHLWQDVRQEPNGQYQFGSRTYDPAKGAFLTPDANQGQQPAKDLSVQVDPLTANTYTYVNGDPVNLVDPNGHAACAGDSQGSCMAPGRNGTYTSAQTRAASSAAQAERVPTSRHHPGLSGGQLATVCAKQLNCTLPDFEAMDSGARYDWMSQFQSDYGTQGWFNNVLGVIHAFGDAGLVTPGSWYSTSDASTLQAIEGGYDAFTKRPSVDGMNPAASKWSAFFDFRQAHPNDVSGAQRLWGAAEFEAVHSGAALADSEGLSRPPGVQTFINTGDEYRNALQSQNTENLRETYAWIWGKENCNGWSLCVAGAISGTHIYSDQALLDTTNESFTYQNVRDLLFFLKGSSYH
jgi:RHS repeat-associated protein